jgi:hypothetical protein
VHARNTPSKGCGRGNVGVAAPHRRRAAPSRWGPPAPLWARPLLGAELGIAGAPCKGFGRGNLGGCRRQVRWLLRTGGGRHRRGGAHPPHCGLHRSGLNRALLGRPSRAAVEEILGRTMCAGRSGPAAGGTVAVVPARPAVGPTVRSRTRHSLDSLYGPRPLDSLPPPVDGGGSRRRRPAAVPVRPVSLEEGIARAT